MKSIIVYSLIIVVIFFALFHVVHVVLGRLDRIGEAYERLPVVLPVVFALAIIVITALRVIGFIGARNLLYLVVGKYHRPVLERRVFLFLDIKGSTRWVERLGAVQTRTLIGKFFFDISRPITDHGGEIYRFTGDGVVATWDWNPGGSEERVVRAIDAMRRAVDDEADYYRSAFGGVPEYRIGVHGGDIVTSEEGDIKRAIGFYGDTIHIAARLEEKARDLGVNCLISEDLVNRLPDMDHRLHVLGSETFRGTSKPINVYALREAGGPA